jgi:hypothetical protein
MKQGSGRNVTAGGMTQPSSHAVSVDKVANIGLKIVRTVPPTKDLYKGRGYEAPMNKCSSNPKGSQGKY